MSPYITATFSESKRRTKIIAFEVLRYVISLILGEKAT